MLETLSGRCSSISLIGASMTLMLEEMAISAHLGTQESKIHEISTVTESLLAHVGKY
jgi:hypothetical protein